MFLPAVEVNFDGLVGLTHNFGGLSYGNLPSMQHENWISYPKQAALQGLEKMKRLADLGIPQAVLPPHERPHIPTLRALGFKGVDRNIPEKVYKINPIILRDYTSASAMWTANWATISPSIDCIDKKIHITPANLINQPHRAIEAITTAKILKAIFSDPMHFVHHPPLPYSMHFCDEGAANQMRFCENYHQSGVYLFVYGVSTFSRRIRAPKIFPARQTLGASETIVRSHRLFEDRIVFARQSPLAIDAGVFHNDVISVGNQHIVFYHQHAFANTSKVMQNVKVKMEKYCNTPLITLEVPEEKVSIQDALQTYLFNSQIVTLPDGNFSLIAPSECQQHPRVYEFLQKLIADAENPIREVHYFPLRESMKNGGGPACLRIRVILNEQEIQTIRPNIFLSANLYEKLVVWIHRHYREQLIPSDLADPALFDESRASLDELTAILEIGSIYSFQT